jgi:hypothetical protein
MEYKENGEKKMKRRSRRKWRKGNRQRSQN